MGAKNTGQVVVIGAGMGGMSAAIHLAAAGRKVVVLEQNSQVGGKLGEWRADGYRWDTGPTVITMRPVFEELFAAAGRHLEDYVRLKPIEPLTRYFFADGNRLDATTDIAEMNRQIAVFAPEDVAGYQKFMAYAADLFSLTAPVFIHDRPPRLSSLFKVKPWDVLRFDGLRTMQQAIDSFVSSGQMRQLLGRFATYVGGSPFLAPAALNVIAHVELAQGIFMPEGGVMALGRAYEKLARELGVEIRLNTRAEKILIENNTVQGVRCDDGRLLPATAVVANVDAGILQRKLLPDLQVNSPPAKAAELSCSGFVLLLGLRGTHPELVQHNIFFSSDSKREFEQIFEEGRPPVEPTIYISIGARSTPDDAPPGCENWFVLVNVPPLGPGWDWAARAGEYRGLVLARLAKHGLDIRDKIEVERILTPVDIERMTGAQRGALYGLSSNNRWGAFRRPHNRVPGVRGVYLAGGTTHPGGGVPMVTLSGKVAAELLLEDGF